MLPNPYLLLLGLLIFGSALFGAERYGEDRGIALQAKTDQVRFNKIEEDIANQKAMANHTLMLANEEATKQSQAAALAHQQQEYAHETDLARTNAARAAGFAAGRLRFAAATPVDAGRGAGGSCAVPSTADAAGPAPAATVELSDATSGALRELAFDCDNLADSYRAAYRFLFPSWSMTAAPQEQGMPDGGTPQPSGDKAMPETRTPQAQDDSSRLPESKPTRQADQHQGAVSDAAGVPQLAHGASAGTNAVDPANVDPQAHLTQAERDLVAKQAKTTAEEATEVEKNLGRPDVEMPESGRSPVQHVMTKS